MKDRDAADWEELARREPYFAVLNDQGALDVDSNKIATAAFFETGEQDVAALLAAITSLVDEEIPMTSTLDFGCGVGRLTLPLARRATSVVACDIAPTMLAIARQNAESAGLHNITYIESDDLAALQGGTFDFICSLLVLQYIRPAVGYAVVRTLLKLLAPEGIAALQMTFERPRGDLRRLARVFSGKTPLARRSIDDDRPTYARIHEYSRNAIHRHVEAAGAQVIARFPMNQGETAGAVLVIQKRST